MINNCTNSYHGAKNSTSIISLSFTPDAKVLSVSSMTSEQTATDAKRAIKIVEIIIVAKNYQRGTLITWKKCTVGSRDTLNLTTLNGPRWRAMIGFQRARVSWFLKFCRIVIGA